MMKTIYSNMRWLRPGLLAAILAVCFLFVTTAATSASPVKARQAISVSEQLVLDHLLRGGGGGHGSGGHSGGGHSSSSHSTSSHDSNSSSNESSGTHYYSGSHSYTTYHSSSSGNSPFEWSTCLTLFVITAIILIVVMAARRRRDS